MTVAQMIEELSRLPGHWPVHVAMPVDGSGGGADTEYLYTLGVEASSFPTQGNMAVVLINQEPR